jgi:hypothetical protein
MALVAQDMDWFDDEEVPVTAVTSTLVHARAEYFFNVQLNQRPTVTVSRIHEVNNNGIWTFGVRYRLQGNNRERRGILKLAASW